MISTTGEYALRAAVHLAQEGRARTSAEIAEATMAPHGYLSKMMQQLVRAGLVLSQRGRNGGFVLARDASEISVLDVLRAVDAAPGRIGKCPLGIEGHARLCPLHRLLDQAMGEVEAAFAASDLATLARSARGVAALCAR